LIALLGLVSLVSFVGKLWLLQWTDEPMNLWAHAMSHSAHTTYGLWTQLKQLKGNKRNKGQRSSSKSPEATHRETKGRQKEKEKRKKKISIRAEGISQVTSLRLWAQEKKRDEKWLM
jgi:hypothetical protein